MTVSSASGFANQLRERIETARASIDKAYGVEVRLTDEEADRILAALEAAQRWVEHTPLSPLTNEQMRELTRDALADLDSGKRTPAVAHEWGGDGGCYTDHDCGDSGKRT